MLPAAGAAAPRAQVRRRTTQTFVLTLAAIVINGPLAAAPLFTEGSLFARTRVGRRTALCVKVTSDDPEVEEWLEGSELQVRQTEVTIRRLTQQVEDQQKEREKEGDPFIRDPNSAIAAKDIDTKYAFEFGWNAELGKWVDSPNTEVKWWQRPSYLTPKGYPQPPHWSKATYALCLEELKLGMYEAALMEDLKKKGMTREEIDAKCAMYEFMQDDDKPKMTKKMEHFFQVKALQRGLDDWELVDMRKNKPKTPTYKAGTKPEPKKELPKRSA